VLAASPVHAALLIFEVIERPSCVIRADEFEGELRPRFLKGEGVGALVWELSKRVGLSQMGVSLRSTEPGFKSTNRHFHTVEEEWVFVLSGEGFVRIGPHRLPVRSGSFIGFPQGPRPHHFEASGEQPLVFLEGGERRKDEDTGWYVDDGWMWEPGGFKETKQPPPQEEGDASQCVHLDELPRTIFQHEVDARAIRQLSDLRSATGLMRQAVRWARVAAGDRSTAYHTHDRTDEWVYILEGRANVRVGDDHFEVSAGDFLGHPAGGLPHRMEPTSEITYLMGGQSDPDDVVDYPEAGVQRRNGRIVPAHG
jgi:uncharacterized cupin superfamily protein